MAQFFFHVGNDKTTLKDEVDEELAGAAEAMAQATIIAKE